MKKTIILITLLTITTLNANNYQKRYIHNGVSNHISYQKNVRSGFNNVHKAALKGDSHSQYSLALMFHYGKGIRQNAELARLWFTRAAKKGHPQAQTVLYRFYSAKKPQYLSRQASRYTMQFRRFR